jgi:adenine phosphoribosyltransferase
MTKSTFDPGLQGELEPYIRDIPDFPKEGIVFKDITPLLASPSAFNLCLDGFDAVCTEDVEVVVGIESRGFIFGAALAARKRIPFVPARKPGKLPAETVRVEYALEYGTDSLEIHKDALRKGQKVLIVDDLLATGGTAKACGELVQQLGAEVSAYGFVIDLAFLGGAAKLAPAHVHTLIRYE